MKLSEAKQFIKSLGLPSWFKVTGSIKRNEPTVNDIDFIIVDHPISKAIEILKLKHNVSIHSNGQSYASLRINGHKVDIWKTTKPSYLFTKVARDSPKQFNIIMRKKAKEEGLKLNDKGL